MYRFKLLVFCIGYIFLLSISLLAQQEQDKQPEYGWQNEIVGSLYLTQASFDNWSQGGEDSFAWQVNLNADFTLVRERFKWSNHAEFSYGLAKVGDSETRKSADDIKLESVYTRKINLPIDPFLSFNALTQFTSGFEVNDDVKTKVSDFFDPAYFTQSAGFSYTPTDEFETRFGFTVKETLTNNFPSPYADDPETPKMEKTKIEPGASSVTEFKKKIEEDILLTSRFDIFSDLEAIDRIDVIWENDAIFKISKFVNVNLTVDLFYDKDISAKRQLKQILALGLTYTFL